MRARRGFLDASIRPLDFSANDRMGPESPMKEADSGSAPMDGLSWLVLPLGGYVQAYDWENGDDVDVDRNNATDAKWPADASAETKTDDANSRSGQIFGHWTDVRSRHRVVLRHARGLPRCSSSRRRRRYAAPRTSWLENSIGGMRRQPPAGANPVCVYEYHGRSNK